MSGLRRAEHGALWSGGASQAVVVVRLSRTDGPAAAIPGPGFGAASVASSPGFKVANKWRSWLMAVDGSCGKPEPNTTLVADPPKAERDGSLRARKRARKTAVTRFCIDSEMRRSRGLGREFRARRSWGKQDSAGNARRWILRPTLLHPQPQVPARDCLPDPRLPARSVIPGPKLSPGRFIGDGAIGGVDFQSPAAAPCDVPQVT
jgi:hypothetical protein